LFGYLDRAELVSRPSEHSGESKGDVWVPHNRRRPRDHRSDLRRFSGLAYVVKGQSDERNDVRTKRRSLILGVSVVVEGRACDPAERNGDFVRPDRDERLAGRGRAFVKYGDIGEPFSATANRRKIFSDRAP
jgi:hypothetical protein